MVDSSVQVKLKESTLSRVEKLFAKIDRTNNLPKEAGRWKERVTWDSKINALLDRAEAILK